MIGVDDGRIAASAQLDELLQQSVDELHRMRDVVIAGKRVSAATHLEQRIQSVGAGGEVVAVPDAEAPHAESSESADDSVSVQFTPEPEDTVSMVIVDSPVEESPESAPEWQESAPAAEVEEPISPDEIEAPDERVEEVAQAAAAVDSAQPLPEQEPAVAEAAFTTPA